MRAPLAYVGTRSRRPPRSAHTDWPTALPLRSQHAMSIAESASVKIPPGPAPPAARRSFRAMASTCVGSSPTTRSASPSTAALSAWVSAPPKNVRPRPTRPWSGPSASVTNSRVSLGAGRPTTSGLSAGVLSTRVVTWVTFMAAARILARRSGRCGGVSGTRPGPARGAEVRPADADQSRISGAIVVMTPPVLLPAAVRGVALLHPDRVGRHVVHVGPVVHGGRDLVYGDGRRRHHDDRRRGHHDRLDDGRGAPEDARPRDDLVEHGERAEAQGGVGGRAGQRHTGQQQHRDQDHGSHASHGVSSLVELTASP